MKAERKSFMKMLLKIAADMMAEHRGMVYRQAKEVLGFNTEQFVCSSQM